MTSFPRYVAGTRISFERPEERITGAALSARRRSFRQHNAGASQRDKQRKKEDEKPGRGREVNAGKEGTSLIANVSAVGMSSGPDGEHATKNTSELFTEPPSSSVRLISC
ncbi:hypothetical protein DPEC_G00102880 [Dallia pectoralis]|uniref:Uncharacterized protein n=1 Tax=Dallia pectoralis TaxID=75939 RepID=A0ACC2GXB1_DALPE|nr:hypothetical protein DPEC_G00102880 [Dallia pectoralis]